MYSLNRYPSKDKLPKYNNLFFKFEKSKIRDYYYRNTFSNFHSKKKPYSKDNFQELKVKDGNNTSNNFNTSINIIKE